MLSSLLASLSSGQVEFLRPQLSSSSAFSLLQSPSPLLEPQPSASCLLPRGETCRLAAPAAFSAVFRPLFLRSVAVPVSSGPVVSPLRAALTTVATPRPPAPVASRLPVASGTPCCGVSFAAFVDFAVAPAGLALLLAFLLRLLARSRRMTLPLPLLLLRLRLRSWRSERFLGSSTVGGRPRGGCRPGHHSSTSGFVPASAAPFPPDFHLWWSGRCRRPLGSASPRRAEGSCTPLSRALSASHSLPPPVTLVSEDVFSRSLVRSAAGTAVIVGVGDAASEVLGAALSVVALLAAEVPLPSFPRSRSPSLVVDSDPCARSPSP